MGKFNVKDFINEEKNFVIKQIKEKLSSIDNYDDFNRETSNALNLFEYRFNSSYKVVIR